MRPRWLALASVLGHSAEDAAGTVKSTGSRSLFVSHTRVDKDIARDVYHYLTAERGVRCWLDEAEIVYGQSILAAVSSAIAEVDFIGVVLSPDSVTAPWVLDELRLAEGQMLRGRPIQVSASSPRTVTFRSTWPGGCTSTSGQIALAS